MTQPTPDDFEVVREFLRNFHDGLGFGEAMNALGRIRERTISIWQPIETAPKDGTEILTYRNGLMAVAAYFPTGWCVSDGCDVCGVSHWMPLPETPNRTTED